MHNYYFVAPSLPPLVLGETPEVTFDECMVRLELNLNKEDISKVVLLRLVTDLQNIRALYLDEPIDSHGNLTEKELDEALLVEADLPEYVFAFLSQFESNQDKASHFFGLLARYYSEEIPKQTGFLKDLLIFQRSVRLILTAIRAKKMHRDILAELQFEDFTDPIIAQILAQKDAKDYDPPEEFQDLKEALTGCGSDPWQQYKTVLSYQFNKIEEMTGFPLFSIDWILGYVARLMLAEHWMQLDDQKGSEIAQKYKTG